MQVALTIPTWTKGLRYFLEQKKFQAAISDDLYNGIQQALNEDFPSSDLNIDTVFRSWENQPGFPLITVSKSGNQVTMTQERFFYNNDVSTSLWWIPINYVVGSNPNFTESQPDFWIRGQKTVTLSSNSAPKSWSDNDWIIVNIQQTGYFRVNYDDNLWTQIMHFLHGTNWQQIQLLNRAQLIDDSLSLARASKIDYKFPLGILQYLAKEADYIPWASVNI